MMNKIKSFFSLLVIVATILSSCKDDKAVYITINKPNTTVEVGQELRLSATVNGVDIDNLDKTITWSTDPNEYISIDSKGLVKGIKLTPIGKTVSVKATLPSGEYATAIVRVVPQNPTTTGFQFEHAVYYFDATPDEAGGADTTIVLNIKPNNLLEKYDVEWSVDNTQSIIIKSNKKEKDRAKLIVASRYKGEAIITATLGKMTATCKIYVGARVDLTWGTTYIKNKPITLSSETMFPNSTKEIAAYCDVLPDDTASINSIQYRWEVEGAGLLISNIRQDPSDKRKLFATITSGVTFGTPKVFLSARDKRIELLVTIRERKSVETVILRDMEKTLDIGETFVTSFSVTPSSALADWIPEWSSDNARVATVDNTGLIKATGAGTANIRLKVGGKIATLKLTVKAKVDQVVLQEGKTILMVDDRDTWTAAVQPASVATLFPISWTSSNSGVASINSSTGLVTAISQGTTTITATAGGKSTTRTLSVIPKENGNITLSLSDIAGAVYEFNRAAKTLNVLFDTNIGRNYTISIPLDNVTNGTFNFNSGEFLWRHLSNYSVRIQSGSIQISDGSDGKQMHIQANLLRGDGATMKIDITVDAAEQ